MFGIDFNEFMIIAIVALVVIGPKDLPRVMRALGNFVAQARGMARSFRGGVDAMMRESELADMEKKWQADNDRIMREHPVGTPVPALEGDSPSPEDWPEPAAGPDLAKPAKPLRLAKPRPDRPKPPPRRAPSAKPAPDEPA
jgi:sec-independent protein translocase protein TatB